MPQSINPKVGKTATGFHPLIQPFPPARDAVVTTTDAEKAPTRIFPNGIHPLIEPFPHAKDVAVATDVGEVPACKFPNGIHPLIEPFPPAREDFLGASQASDTSSKHRGMNTTSPPGDINRVRAPSHASTVSSESNQSSTVPKVRLRSMAGMRSVPHMPPCSECGDKLHQRTHCFLAHPRNLEKYIETHQRRAAFWEKRVADHKLAKEEKRKEEEGKFFFLFLSTIVCLFVCLDECS